jgi:hypothetical protein
MWITVSLKPFDMVYSVRERRECRTLSFPTSDLQAVYKADGGSVPDREISANGSYIFHIQRVFFTWLSVN